MRYELRLTAFDMLDQVHVSITLEASSGAGEDAPPPPRHWTATVPGTGQLGPHEWSRDALVTALEAL
jgi:hypothetical protein